MVLVDVPFGRLLFVVVVAGVVSIFFKSLQDGFYHCFSHANRVTVYFESDVNLFGNEEIVTDTKSSQHLSGTESAFRADFRLRHAKDILNCYCYKYKTHLHGAYNRKGSNSCNNLRN